MKRLLAILALLTLVACAGGGHRDEGVLTPLPAGIEEPDDAALKTAVDAFLASGGAPPSSLYDMARIDLNGDRRREALVLFKNPWGYWCDRHGCTMLVFAAGRKEFTLVNSIQPVRGPVWVAATKTKGWRDLVIHISGRWSETKDVLMNFDGRKYPSTPELLPPHLRYDGSRDTRIFY